MIYPQAVHPVSNGEMNSKNVTFLSDVSISQIHKSQSEIIQMQQEKIKLLLADLKERRIAFVRLIHHGQSLSTMEQEEHFRNLQSELKQF